MATGLNVLEGTAEQGRGSNRDSLDDPLFAGLALIPTPALEWLAEAGYVRPQVGSPLVLNTISQSWSSPVERARAGARLLERDPLSPHGRLQAQRLRLSPLGQALAVLEAPEARLRIALVTPGREPEVRQFFVRGRMAVAGYAEAGGFRLGAPVRVTALLEAVAKHLDSSHLPAEMEAFALLPEVFELLTSMWKKLDKAVDEVIQEPQLAALLGGEPALAESRSLLQAMVMAGLLECHDRAYRLTAELRTWLKLVWSGHVVELEREWLDAPGDDRAASDRLLFAGALGERILCEDLAPEGGQNVLLLSRPGRWELGQRLLRLLTGVLATASSEQSLEEAELALRLSSGSGLSVH